MAFGEGSARRQGPLLNVTGCRIIWSLIAAEFAQSDLNRRLALGDVERERVRHELSGVW